MSDLENAKKEVFDSFKDQFDNLEKNMDEKLEKHLQEIETRNKAMVRDSEEEKEVGKTYTFLDAKADIAKGKTANAPYWDDKNNAQFKDWLHMVHEKDYQAMKKAFGDNVADPANWIPDEFRAELVRLEYINSIMLPKVTIVPMGRDKVTMPKPSGNYTVGFADRGSAMTDSSVSFGKLDLQTAKIYALALIDREDLQDSAYPLASFVASQMGEDFAKFIDKVILYGDADGSAEAYDGEFDGLAHALSVNSVQGGANATPNWGDVWNLENILESVGNLDERALDGGEWFISPMGWNNVRGLQGLTYDGTGKSKNQQPLIPITADYYAPLLGFPVNVSSRVTNTVANDAVMGFFGNPKNIYVGDRMSMGIDTSEHYRFANDQVVYRATQRMAVKVALPETFSKIVAPSAS